MAVSDIEYHSLKPDPALSDFVESFWMLVNHTDQEKEMVVLPDGRVDIFFTYSAQEPFQVMLMGIDTAPSKNMMPPKTVIFAISLKLLSVEYFLDTTFSDLPGEPRWLPVGFLDISKDDLADLRHFSRKATDHIIPLIKANIDDRKRHLFDLVYASNGAITVKELSEKVFWNSRQINRYFNQKIGLSLKAYCNILRFRASFGHIKEGKLFPEENFADQSHFIREIKKYAGVIPKELARNENDRFIQFSILPEK